LRGLPINVDLEKSGGISFFVAIINASIVRVFPFKGNQSAGWKVKDNAKVVPIPVVDRSASVANSREIGQHYHRICAKCSSAQDRGGFLGSFGSN
jgi:hypothetical protein